MIDYSTQKISQKLLLEIVEALQNVRGWGSVEIHIQDHKVVQITERSIKKTQTQKPAQVIKMGS